MEDDRLRRRRGMDDCLRSDESSAGSRAPSTDSCVSRDLKGLSFMETSEEDSHSTVVGEDSTSSEEIDVENLSGDERPTCARHLAYDGRRRRSLPTLANRRPPGDTDGDVIGGEDILRANRKTGKRKNSCPFCRKLVSNYSRHLLTQHSEREEVKEYAALAEETPRKRRRRRAEITKSLMNLGNHAHNKEIVEGERISGFLPARMPSHGKRVVDNSTHVTCKHCLGFFRKDFLYQHLKNCPKCPERPLLSAPSSSKKTRVLSEHSELLVKDNARAHGLLRDEVFPKMLKDAESLVVQSDALIIRYGSNFRFNHRGTNQIHYCSSRMRSLARLFLTMKETMPELKELRDCISPKHFDVLVEAVRRMSGFDSTDGHSKMPSVPPRLCSSLKSCANIIISQSVKDDKLDRREKTEISCEMNDFLHLMEKDWATEISTNSEKSRKRLKVMKADLLPDPNDIVTFAEYANGLYTPYARLLELVPTASNYEALAKVIIAHMIVLNRRRPNETVEITLEAYRSSLNRNVDYGRESQNVLTEEEMATARQLSIFYIPASKNLKKVPIILTKPMNQALDKLIESRPRVGVTNRFLFGRPGGVELFNGTAVMKELANKAHLKSPSTFTANSLRHHAATSSQLRARNDTYTKRLAKFLGHDVKTHEQFYEMPLPLVQKAIVGHQLLQMTLPKPPRPSHTVTSQTSGDGPSSFRPSRGATGESSEPSFGVHSSVNESQEAFPLTLRQPWDDSPPEPSPPEPSPPEPRSPHPCSSHLKTPPPAPRSASRLLDRDSGNDSSTVEATPKKTRTTTAKRSVRNVSRHKTFDRFLDEFSSPPRGTTPSRPGREVWRPSDAVEVDSRDTTREESLSPQSVQRPPRGSPESESTSVKSTPKKKHKKTRWSSAEKRTIYQRFAHSFIVGVRPQRKDIVRAWEEEEILKNRSIQQVVTYINNIVTHKQKIPTPVKKKMKNMLVNCKAKLSP